MSVTRGTHSRTAKLDPRTEPQTFTGLCSTCIYASECATVARADVPVVHCEQFDDRIASPMEVMKSPVIIGLRSEKKSPDEVGVDPELKGLCVNCDNRKICLRPKPAGGVWYCEEYR